MNLIYSTYNNQLSSGFYEAVLSFLASVAVTISAVSVAEACR